MRLKCGRWTISPGLSEATPSTRSVFASTNCFDESIVEGGDGQKEEEESRVAPSSHPDPDESTSVRPPDLHQQGQPGHGGERERESARIPTMSHIVAPLDKPSTYRDSQSSVRPSSTSCFPASLPPLPES